MNGGLDVLCITIIPNLFRVLSLFWGSILKCNPVVFHCRELRLLFTAPKTRTEQFCFKIKLVQSTIQLNLVLNLLKIFLFLKMLKQS